jgi:Bacterial Ig-like domain (group 1)/PKD domain
MVTQRRILLALLALLALPLAIVAGCDKVPLLAPTGSVISLFAVTTTVSLNSEVDIIATVIENGQASGTTGSGTGGTTTTSRTGAGTPVQNGTVITFTTTIGRVEPSEARTHNGQVTVKLITAGTSGTATITAYSGGASAQLTNLKIGTAAAKTVSVTTTPQALGASGGTAQVTASVTDDGGSPIGGVPVTLSTDKGSISPSTVTTDGSGNATATLTTNATAKITATVGALTGTSTVTVNVRSLSSFTASPSAASAGVPITFTVTPTAGANISSVHVDFGDGQGRDLGAISGATTVPYAYTSSGNYTGTATARDSSGDSGSLTTSVIIGSLPVTLNASPNPAAVSSPVTFSVGGVGSAQVDHYNWTFDDGTSPPPTTAPQLTHTFTSRGLKNARVDVIGVGGGKLGTASVTIDVQ